MSNFTNFDFDHKQRLEGVSMTYEATTYKTPSLTKKGKKKKKIKFTAKVSDALECTLILIHIFTLQYFYYRIKEHPSDFIHDEIILFTLHACLRLLFFEKEKQDTGVATIERPASIHPWIGPTPGTQVSQLLGFGSHGRRRMPASYLQRILRSGIELTDGLSCKFGFTFCGVCERLTTTEPVKGHNPFCMA
jgi:hypothetical protein